MPIQQKSAWSGTPGKEGFEFTGKIVGWLEEFERWFKEETRSKPADIPFDDYVYLLTVLYSHYAKIFLQKQQGAEKIIENIDSFFPRETYSVRPGDPNFNLGNLPVSYRLFYLLDLLAEAFPPSFREHYEQSVRDYARKFVWFQEQEKTIVNQPELTGPIKTWLDVIQRCWEADTQRRADYTMYIFYFTFNAVMKAAKIWDQSFLSKGKAKNIAELAQKHMGRQSKDLNPMLVLQYLAENVSEKELESWVNELRSAAMKDMKEAKML